MLGRCYATPTDCGDFVNATCKHNIVEQQNHGDGHTCEVGSDPEHHCEEHGPFKECIKYALCTADYDEWGNVIACTLIVPQGGWTLKLTQGPASVTGVPGN